MTSGRNSNPQALGSGDSNPRSLSSKGWRLTVGPLPKEPLADGTTGTRLTSRPVADLTVVILAAGEGTRMRSATPKVLHPLCGRPLVMWPVLAARDAGADRIIVVDGPKRVLEGNLPPGVDIAIQEEPRGTGDAMKAAA